MKSFIISGKIFCPFIALSLFMVLHGCGGGGGDSSGSSMIYSGIETQAVVTTSNAEDIATGAYSGGSIGPAFSAVQGTVDRPRYLQVIMALEKSMKDMELIGASEDVPGAVQKTASNTISGSCGGSASYTITYDDVTGDFSGSMNFNNYCSEAVTISGSVNVSGKIDLGTKEFLIFIFILNNINATDGTESETMEGTISFHREPSLHVEMTLLLRDNSSNKVYRMTDFRVNMSTGSDYIDIEMTGKFYHPDQGFVNVSTTAPFRIYSGDNHPSEGVLILEGYTGIAGGSTLARLTVLSASTYEIAADTDGDGVYDWSSVNSW
jgi:hypothetical protein